MGEMLTLMEACDVCFMGGSLLGNKVGGHNMLEPAALGKYILTGPSYYNFSDIVQEMLGFNAITVIHNPEEMAQTISELFEVLKMDEQIESPSLLFIKQNQGSIDKTLGFIDIQH